MKKIIPDISSNTAHIEQAVQGRGWAVHLRQPGVRQKAWQAGLGQG